MIFRLNRIALRRTDPNITIRAEFVCDWSRDHMAQRLRYVISNEIAIDASFSIAEHQ
jgi:hypothetical protein